MKEFGSFTRTVLGGSFLLVIEELKCKVAIWKSKASKVRNYFKGEEMFFSNSEEHTSSESLLLLSKKRTLDTFNGPFQLGASEQCEAC